MNTKHRKHKMDRKEYKELHASQEDFEELQRSRLKRQRWKDLDEEEEDELLNGSRMDELEESEDYIFEEAMEYMEEE